MSRVIRAELRLPSVASQLRTRRSTTRLIAWTADPRTRGRPRLFGQGTRMLSAKAEARQSHTAASESPEHSRNSTMAAIAQKIKAPEGELAIVFTDIVKSTYIWENEPLAMKTAMVKHDEMVRAVTVRHQGYEVKQNGDGFMLAFQTAISALEFCLEVQEQLLDIEWPEDLLKIGAGSEVKDKDDDDGDGLLFKGLRLRMSCHWGSPVVVPNEVIGRMDYMGPMVNRAARFIQATEGGQIVVSEPFLHALAKTKNGESSDRDTSEGPLFAAKVEEGGENEDDELGQKIDLSDLRAEHTESILRDKHFEVRSLGKRHFKGVSDLQTLYFIIPESLQGRLHFWPKHMQVEGSKGNLAESG